MGGHFDLEVKSQKINEIEKELQDENIWNNIDKANKLNNELVNLKKSVENYQVIHNKIEDSIGLLEIELILSLISLYIKFKKCFYG